MDIRFKLFIGVGVGIIIEILLLAFFGYLAAFVFFVVFLIGLLVYIVQLYINDVDYYEDVIDSFLQYTTKTTEFLNSFAQKKFPYSDDVQMLVAYINSYKKGLENAVADKDTRRPGSIRNDDTKQ